MRKGRKQKATYRGGVGDIDVNVTRFEGKPGET